MAHLEETRGDLLFHFWGHTTLNLKHGILHEEAVLRLIFAFFSFFAVLAKQNAGQTLNSLYETIKNTHPPAPTPG
jgi:hypothetical protein